MKKCSTVMLSGRGLGCSSRIAFAIVAASGGRAPEWLETSSAPPVGGHVLDPLHLDPEPVAVEELDHGAVEDLLDPLRASPVVDPALGLDRRQQVAVALRRQRRLRLLRR